VILDAERIAREALSYLQTGLEAGMVVNRMG
jgi:hypothetical protein